MHIIADSADSLVCTLANDCEIEINCSFVDMTTTATTPGHEHAISAGSAGDYDICPAPSESTQRIVKSASIYNADTTEVASLEIWHSAGGSERKQLTLTLLRGESLHYEDGRGWYRLGPTDSGTYSGRSVGFLKFGTGADTVGYFYCHSKDVGFPGAFAVGTPGLGGRTTDGTTSTDAGCLVVPDAATGGNFLTSFELSSTVAQFYLLIDVLWVNSGAVVTTTTGQTVDSGTLPARDANGTTDGEGCMIGLLFTSASTNAAVINNATVTYTNSDGTGSRTATLANLVGAQIPVSPVVGTIVWFGLQAGDKGVRSIQTLTLGTSLVTGAVSLLIARQVATYSSIVANVGNGPRQPMEPGIRLWNGSCLFLCYQASATTATTAAGSITVQERAV